MFSNLFHKIVYKPSSDTLSNSNSSVFRYGLANIFSQDENNVANVMRLSSGNENNARSKEPDRILIPRRRQWSKRFGTVSYKVNVPAARRQQRGSRPINIYLDSGRTARRIATDVACLSTYVDRHSTAVADLLLSVHLTLLQSVRRSAASCTSSSERRRPSWCWPLSPSSTVVSWSALFIWFLFRVFVVTVRLPLLN